MRTIRIFIFIVLTAPFFNACDLLNTTDTNPLSENEVIEGLKTALLVGTDTSVSVVSNLNGFYKDEAIKILLPPEADIIYQYKDNILFTATGLDKKLEEAIMAINYAAEDAAKEAAPIFKSAITDMSISDGWSILNGTNPAASKKAESFDSTAATAYLKSTTYTQLSNAFSPKINTSLDKKLVGNFSSNQLWGTLTTSYNSVANKSFGMIPPIQNTNLGVYVTGKALDGLFLKVSDQERQIRRDPLKWAETAVGNILERVFGSSTI
jgi:hypothetical protein